MLDLGTPNTQSSDSIAVTATATLFAVLKMVANATYRYSSDTNAWIAQGINDTVVTANASTDTFTATAHGLTTGQPVQMTAGTTLPTGISAVTTYFAIVKTVDTFQLATTRANALAGTQIDITDTGTGTLTVKTIATTGAGSMYVAAGVQVPLKGSLGPALSVLRNTADGRASLTIVSL